MTKRPEWPFCEPWDNLALSAVGKTVKRGTTGAGRRKSSILKLIRKKNDVSRSDQLAEDRTRLANLRTFLAFVRTAIMIFATGITFIKLFPGDEALVVIGWVLVPVALFTLALGFVLYLRMNKELKDSTGDSG